MRRDGLWLKKITLIRRPLQSLMPPPDVLAVLAARRTEAAAHHVLAQGCVTPACTPCNHHSTLTRVARFCTRQTRSQALQQQRPQNRPRRRAAASPVRAPRQDYLRVPRRSRPLPPTALRPTRMRQLLCHLRPTHSRECPPTLPSPGGHSQQYRPRPLPPPALDHRTNPHPCSEASRPRQT